MTHSTATPVSARPTPWMSARARNAARRVWLIALAGLLAVAGTLAVLIFVPREVDRALRDRIAALPPLVDTLPLHDALETARARQAQADAHLRAVRTADADRIAVAVQSDPTASDRPSTDATTPATESDARRELGVRVTRARTAPLAESFRAIGETELMRSDARVRALMDSLDDVNRDREAYAALGGADARYAALTARLSTLGQRILAIAEQRLAATAPTAAVGVAPVAVSTLPAPPPAASAAAAPPLDSANALADSATLAPRSRFNVDSVGERRAQTAFDSAAVQATRAAQALERAVQSNTNVLRRQEEARAEFTVRVPMVAMLLAALALGLAIGYGVAFVVEARNPRVADVAEIERVAAARVVVHSGVPSAMRAARPQRRREQNVPRVIDAASDSYQLLLVTLTGFGDTTRVVRVMSDAPRMAATVGINLAAASAREARTTLVLDGDLRVRLVAPMLELVNQGGIAEALTSPASLASRPVRINVGREQTMDALLAGSASTAASPGTPTLRQQFVEQLQALLTDYDFTVIVAPNDIDVRADWVPSSDVILCVRIGATRLDWLTRAVAHAAASGVRVRGVLAWTARAP